MNDWVKEWMTVKYQRELWTRLFYKDIINPAEAKGDGNIYWPLSSVHWFNQTSKVVGSHFFKLHVPALFFISVTSSSFIFLSLLLFLLLWCAFHSLWPKQWFVLPNVLWLSGKFLECRWWAGTEAIGEQRCLVLDVCHPGNHRSRTEAWCHFPWN